MAMSRPSVASNTASPITWPRYGMLHPSKIWRRRYRVLHELVSALPLGARLRQTRSRFGGLWWDTSWPECVGLVCALRVHNPRRHRDAARAAARSVVTAADYGPAAADPHSPARA